MGAVTRLLLVEDDSAIAEPLSRALDREGYTDTRASRGIAALPAGRAADAQRRQEEALAGYEEREARQEWPPNHTLLPCASRKRDLAGAEYIGQGVRPPQGAYALIVQQHRQKEKVAGEDG